MHAEITLKKARSGRAGKVDTLIDATQDLVCTSVATSRPFI
jgi:hypothetical protein